VNQLAEVTENPQRGGRGLIVPAATVIGIPGEDTRLPQTVAELKRSGSSRAGRAPRRVHRRPDPPVLEDLAPDRVFISGRQQPGSKRTQRRLRKYRTGAEERISHVNTATGWTDPAAKATKPADLDRMGDPRLADMLAVRTR